MKVFEGKDAATDHVRRFVTAYQDTTDPHALLQVAVGAMLQSEDVPREVASAFQDAVSRFQSGEMRTLDEALQVAHPKGFRLHDYRNWRRYSSSVYREVCRLHEDEGLPIDEDIFQLAGSRFNVGKTAAAEMYYAWRENKQNDRQR